MNIFKKVLFIVAFVICTLIVPYVFLALFVDAINHFNVYVIVTAVIIFAIWGYVIISIHNMSKELHEAVEAMKMQNAAIAFKLTEDVYKGDKDGGKKKKGNKKDFDDSEKVDTSNVNLNPADPLVYGKKSKINDNYDDFN